MPLSNGIKRIDQTPEETPPHSGWAQRLSDLMAHGPPARENEQDAKDKNPKIWVRPIC